MDAIVADKGGYEIVASGDSISNESAAPTSPDNCSNNWTRTENVSLFTLF